MELNIVHTNCLATQGEKMLIGVRVDSCYYKFISKYMIYLYIKLYTHTHTPKNKTPKQKQKASMEGEKKNRILRRNLNYSLVAIFGHTL